MRYFKKLSVHLFDGQRNVQSIKGRFERSRTIFKGLLAFESFTGGGGDADEEGEKSLEERIVYAKSKRSDMGSVTSETYTQWQTTGWYNLFYNRFKNHPNILREFEYHSGSISPRKNSGDKSNSETNSDSDTSDEPSQPPVKSKNIKGLAKLSGVPEPKHHGRHAKSALSSQASEFFDANAQFLKATQKTNEGQLDLMRCKVAAEELRLDWDKQLQQKKLDVEEVERKIKMAENILANPNVSAFLKEKAEAILQDYLGL
ncbi:hypothetical protein QCA50_012667 [Cerrena zonata]|uniref:No apical meristem-associated C-terminal domain-containing protein n=1 Tax=Cerrena zonata TaxID=2478898 RepID=A0AAW0FTH0_9APHY